MSSGGNTHLHTMILWPKTKQYLKNMLTPTSRFYSVNHFVHSFETNEKKRKNSQVTPNEPQKSHSSPLRDGVEIFGSRSGDPFYYVDTSTQTIQQKRKNICVPATTGNFWPWINKGQKEKGLDSKESGLGKTARWVTKCKTKSHFGDDKGS